MRHYCPHFVDIIVLTPKLRGRREQNWVVVCIFIKSAPKLAPFPISKGRRPFWRVAGDLLPLPQHLPSPWVNGNKYCFQKFIASNWEAGKAWNFLRWFATIIPMTTPKMNAARAARFRQLAFKMFIFERILRHVNITFFTSDTYQKKEKSFLFLLVTLVISIN